MMQRVVMANRHFSPFILTMRALASMVVFLYAFGFSAHGAVTGYASFNGNTTTAPSNFSNLNQDTPYAMRWTIQRMDSTYFSHSTSSFNHEITFKTAGNYRISFSIPLQKMTGANRKSIRAELYLNGSPIDIGRAESGYIRDANGHTKSSLHLNTLLANISANDILELRVSKQTNQVGKVTTTGAQLFLQYVDPTTKSILVKGTSSTVGTNLNTSAGNDMAWDTETVTSSAFSHNTAINNNVITIQQAGSYRLSLNIPLQDASACASGSLRTSIEARIRVNGVLVRSGVAAQGYIRCLDTHDTASIHWFGFLHNMAAGEQVTVSVVGGASTTQAVQVASSRKASLYMEKLSNTNKILSMFGNKLTTGTDWNPTGNARIQWSGEILKDGVTYTHSTVTGTDKITINESGDYLILYTDALRSTAARTNVGIQLRKNGTLSSGAECLTHYIRNAGGHNNSSCSVSYLMENVAAGDIIDIGVATTANAGVVTSLQDAEIHIFQISAHPPILDINSIPNKRIHYDMSNFANVLDSSNRNGGDLSFSGTVATLTDISGVEFSHNGVQTSAAKMPSYFKSTSVLHFDGLDDFFAIQNATDINTGTTSERTFAMVFRTGSDVTTRQMIYEEGGTVRGINVYIRNGSLYLGFWNNTNDGDGVQAFVSTSTPVNASTNYYVTMVYDYSNYTGPTGPNGALRGTINGLPFSFSGSTTSRLYNHPGNIGLGAMNNGTCYDDKCLGGNGNYFGGDIFEFIMYNSAISTALELEYYNFLSNKWPDPFPVTALAINSQYVQSSTLSPNISWNASISTDVNDYVVGIGTTVGGTELSPYQSVGNVTSTQISGLSLAECIPYYISVKAVDISSKASTIKTTNFFKYDGTAPSDPGAIILSGSASNTTSKAFSWSASNDSCAFKSYEVALGSTSSGSDIVPWTDIGSNLSYQFTGVSLSNATNYYVSVRAKDTAGNFSNIISSSAWQVDTCVATDVTAPSDPSGLLLSGAAEASASPTLSWAASSDSCGFGHYEVAIGTSAGASDVVAFTNVGNVQSYKFFSISPALTTNTNYFMSVKAVDLAGNMSNIISSALWNLSSPGNISGGLALWLDAADSSTLFQNSDCVTGAVTTSGSVIGCWKDKSPSGFNATAVGTNRPTYQTNSFNGKAVIRFDGSNDALDFTSIGNIRTVFIVNKSNATTYQPLLGATSTTDWFTNDTSLLGAGSSNFLQNGNWRVNRSSITQPLLTTQTGQYSLYSVVSTGNVSADHISSDRKQAGRFFKGDYVEVIVYNRALSSAEVINVENYLYYKWFSAAPAPLTNLTLSSTFTNVSTTTPTLSWTHSSASDFNHYEVALGKSVGSNDTAGWFNNGVSNQYNFSGAALQECTPYYISARAVDNSGFIGDSVSSLAFKYDGTSPSTPASLVFSGQASSSTSPTLTWGASSDSCGGITYEVSLGTSAGAGDIHSWLNIGNVNSYQFRGLSLSSATNYYMNLRAKDQAGNLSSVISSIAFQIQSCVATDITKPVAPSGMTLAGQPNLSSSPQASFTGGSDTCAFSHHEIAIGTTTSSSDVVNWKNIGTNSAYKFTSITPELSRGVNYYVNVRSVDLAGNISTILSSSAFSLTGPGAVSPTGLEIWADTSDTNGVYSDSLCSSPQVTNNGQVGCLKDFSGNGNNLTTSNTANSGHLLTNAFNGGKSVYFNGASNEFLNFKTRLTNIRTVFWVLKEDGSNLGNTAFLLGDSVGTTTDYARASTGGPIFNATTSSASVRGGSLHLNKKVIDGTLTNVPITESLLSLVTTANTTADSFSRDRVSCCGGRTFGGQLAELIIYNRALSAGEVSNIEDYLMAKWNLATTSTQWTGAVNSDWFNTGNWSNGLPTSSLDCLIPSQVNNPIINGPGATCRDLHITTGSLTFQNATGASLAVFHDINIETGSLTINDGNVIISDNGTIPVSQMIHLNGQAINLTFNKSAGANVQVDQSSTFNSFTMPAGSNFDFIVKASTTSTFPNGLTITGGVFKPESGAVIKLGAGKTLALNGGILKTVGLNDPLGVSGQDMTKKVTFTSVSTVPWAFNATSGIVDLVGFHFKYLDQNGLYIGGTTNLLNLDGGQFSYLKKDYATPAKGIYLDTTSVISESIAVNVGFNWGAPNSGYAGNPLPSDNYYTVYAPNCGGGTLVFDQWFGDFWGATTAFDTELKIFDNADGGNCNVSMDIAVSPVTLTQFKATAYDKAAVIEWTTGSELDHLGFNLYRSTNPTDGYAQINNELIRNYLSSGEFRGRYRFVDPSLTNGQIYYYILEDVATNGDRVQHGPVYAMPSAANGTAPSASPGVNTPISSPGSVNLGSGIALLSQTNGSFRISINPAALILNTAAWDSSHVALSIPGYSKLTLEGAPELLKRRILVPVSGAYSNIHYTIFNKTQSDISGILSGKKVSPAPSFSPDANGKLIAHYSEDMNYYSSSANYPLSEFFKVSSKTVNILGKNYVEITTYPLIYQAALDSLKRLDQLILDIGLDSPAWDYTPPANIYSVSPSVAEDTLTIKYKKEGIYKITFDELANSNLEGPFLNKKIDSLRLFYHGKEVPMEVTSSDIFFNSGDSILFYGPFESGPDDPFDNVVLAPYNFSGGDIASEDALRMAHLVPTNTNFSAQNNSSKVSTLFDNNNYAVFDIPVGIAQEHLYLKRIYTGGGAALNAASSYSENVIVSHIDPNAESIKVKINLLSRKVVSENPLNHIRLSVNGTTVTSHAFRDDKPIKLTFDVPVSYFVSGSNTITFSTLGDLVSAGDFDMVNIERIEVVYDQINQRYGTQSIFSGGLSGEKFTAWNFLNSSLRVFDISTPRNFFEYAQPLVDSFDGGATYQVAFKNLSGFYGGGGSKKIVVEGNSYLNPLSMTLNSGVDHILKDSSNNYDHIIISSQAGMNAAKRLADYRTSNGLNSLAIPLEQVYGEFSNGRKDEFAINAFLEFAKNNWTTPPRFLLVIGDTTYDPKDNLGFVGALTNPVLLYSGQENDFGSDAAYGLTGLGTADESKDPYLAIGRLPTDDSFLIESYVQKLIDYESGAKAPSANVKKGIFIAGQSNDNEDFDNRVNQLSNTMMAANSKFSASVISSQTLSNTSTAKSEVVDAFAQGPLFITYMGHGAEDLWGINGFFNTTDANALSNNRLPIVMGLGCLNSYYYDPDVSWKSLAEEMVLNPNSGAIAFWGSTTFTSPTAQLKLATNSFNEFGQRSKTGQTNTRIGEFMLSAISGMERNQLERDLALSWTLFGDPALKLPSEAFSKPEPAPVQALPAPPRAPVAHKKGGGCSLMAADSTTASSPWDALAFVFEALIYMALYRQRKFLFGLFRGKSS